MTVKELKAWLEGFNEGRNNGWSAGLSEENWKLVQEKIAQLDEPKPVVMPSYKDPYQSPSILQKFPAVTS